MSKTWREPTRSNICIFGGNSHSQLTKDIARKVGIRVGDVQINKFANKEIHVEIRENVRAKDIYLIQTAGGASPNDSLMELLFLINAFKLASVHRINVVTPYFFYSKGDQKSGSKRTPITAKLVADLIKRAGAHHVMMIDPHTPQIQGFFDKPVDALKVGPLFCDWIKKNIPFWDECIIVAPDEGSAKRCTSVANELDMEFALINKRRKGKKYAKDLKKCQGYHQKPRARRATTEHSENEAVVVQGMDSNTVESLASDLDKVARLGKIRKSSVSGSVAGRIAILIDDMIDTGQTIKRATETLKKFGAVNVYVLATHGLFSGDAVNIILAQGDFVRAVVCTNSIPQEEQKERMCGLLHVIEVSGLISEFIRRHHYNESVSVLGQFLPIRDQVSPDKEPLPVESSDDEDDDDNEDDDDDDDDEVDDDSAAEEDAATNNADCDEPRGANSIPPHEMRLMNLRKGFRLSSVCWDED